MSKISTHTDRRNSYVIWAILCFLSIAQSAQSARWDEPVELFWRYEEGRSMYPVISLYNAPEGSWYATCCGTSTVEETLSTYTLPIVPSTRTKYNIRATGRAVAPSGGSHVVRLYFGSATVGSASVSSTGAEFVWYIEGIIRLHAGSGTSRVITPAGILKFSVDSTVNALMTTNAISTDMTTPSIRITGQNTGPGGSPRLVEVISFTVDLN